MEAKEKEKEVEKRGRREEEGERRGRRSPSKEIKEEPVTERRERWVQVVIFVSLYSFL